MLTNSPETSIEPNDYLQEVSSKIKQLIGRGVLALGLLASSVGIIGTCDQEPADASTTFTNDYPNLGAMDYNPSNYDWWVDENGNGIPDVTPNIYTDNDELMSTRGYYYRNCTDGAAYWTQKYTGISVSGWGDAKSWDEAATNAGYTVKSGNSNDIEPGDIAQSDDGYYGHVGFVVEVSKNPDGTINSVTTAELNEQGTGLYSGPGSDNSNIYTSRNSNGNLIRYGTYDWDHFIDVNGSGKGLNNESIGSVSPTNTRSQAQRVDELAFVRTNHSSGRTEIVSLHGAPYYTTLRSSNLTGYPAISDPQNVTPLAIDTNGDGIDELGFVRTNHGSGRTEIVTMHGSPHYTTLLRSSLTAYPAISDPQSVTPLAIDVNGDGIDELGFVRTNHSSGSTELVTLHGSPNYTTIRSSTLTGYPAIKDPQNVTPLAIDVNGDGIDELGFVRTNHSSGRTELSLWHGAPHYKTHLLTTLVAYPAISDPQNVRPIAIDVNGDGIDELAFVRTNHSSGRTEIVTLHGAPHYTTLRASSLTSYPKISDPQNVTPIAIDLP
ncbi:CHAP domain-containing protein [Candidatus Saccharibacteria bacterium]|nr:CHAP domain-containing protein [Candidatus Saccharibacteria bacterium]